jgi:hypothetical protein
MIPEQKDLLLKDLCVRLPYGVKLHCISYTMTCIGPYTLNTIVLDRFCNEDTKYVPFDEVKPYLFPLSSMTKEQESYIHFNTKFRITRFGNIDVKIDEDDNYFNVDEDDWLNLFDWLNKNHFDYRGLIEKGLAIDATGKNIY